MATRRPLLTATPMQLVDQRQLLFSCHLPDLGGAQNLKSGEVPGPAGPEPLGLSQ